jgi:hypothetical protein
MGLRNLFQSHRQHCDPADKKYNRARPLPRRLSTTLLLIRLILRRDAYGRRPIEEIAAAYSNVRVYEIEDVSSHIAESVESETYLPTNIEAGRAFAILLLTE